MATRVTFGPDFVRAIKVRGMTLTEVAADAGISLATVSAAARGRAVNVSSALRMSRAVSAHPVVVELDAWVARDEGGSPRDNRGD